MSKMKHQSLTDWKAEAVERFGAEPAKWAFQCPSCGRKQTGQDFLDRGLDINKVYSNCLGRHDQSFNCNWAAYGLLGTMGQGRIITYEGGESEVFDFWSDEPTEGDDSK